MSGEYYWDIANTTEMGRYLTRQEMSFLRSLFQNSTSIESCLDVGCGSGRFTLPVHALYTQWKRVIGLDIDLLPLTKLKKKGEAEISIILGDATCLLFKDSSFDCIIAMEIVDYFPNMDTFLQECYRVLNEHGYLCFTFSNRNSWKRYLHRLLSQYRTFYRLSLADIKAVLEKRGFKLEAARGLNWQPFGRTSNNKLIRVAERLETLLHLYSLPSLSPGVLITARKQEQPE